MQIECWFEGYVYFSYVSVYVTIRGLGIWFSLRHLFDACSYINVYVMFEPMYCILDVFIIGYQDNFSCLFPCMKSLYLGKVCLRFFYLRAFWRIGNVILGLAKFFFLFK